MFIFQREGLSLLRQPIDVVLGEGARIFINLIWRGEAVIVLS